MGTSRRPRRCAAAPGPGTRPQRRPSRPRTTRGAQGDVCASLYAVRGDWKATGTFRSRNTVHARWGFGPPARETGGLGKIGENLKFGIPNFTNFKF